jgi:membrane-bound metal-dependent hydrolase YbcI (DUF457 family)
MLVGHYAPAFLLHAAAPRVPLWALFLAAQAVDFGFFALAAVGLESAKVTPGGHPVFELTHGVYTHSLPSAIGLTLLCAAIGAALGRAREGAALGVAVGSHWLLDLVMHVPDLPLTFSQSSAVGLGLWTKPVLPWLLEIVLVLATWAVLRPRLPERARPRGDLLAGVLVVLQLLDEHVVPTPTHVVALGASAYGLYLGAATLAWRVDRATAAPARAGS